MPQLNVKTQQNAEKQKRNHRKKHSTISGTTWSREPTRGVSRVKTGILLAAVRSQVESLVLFALLLLVLL
jgi:hypothetical protein